MKNINPHRCLCCFAELPGGEAVCPHCGNHQNSLPWQPEHLRPGCVLAERYLVGRVMGFGRFSATYTAMDLMLEQKVTIKEYLPLNLYSRLPGQPDLTVHAEEWFAAGLTYFLEEAHRMAAFNGVPALSQTKDIFPENNTAYVVMEFLEGKPLDVYLQQHQQPLSFEETWAIAEPVMRTLEEIHKKDGLHGDISPSQIFISQDSCVKVLIDIGAARFAAQRWMPAVLISEPYAPPERYRPKSQDPWTDVYALGATLYRCLTGVLPEESVDRIWEDHLKSPHEMGIALPAYAKKALMKALALKEGRRFSTMEHFRLALTGREHPGRFSGLIPRPRTGSR